MSAPCRLYLITPPRLDDLAGFGRTLALALDAGDVAALQLRLKDAPESAVAAAIDVLFPIAAARDVALILNDRPDWAAKYGCDGVHVGQDDTPCAEARKITWTTRKETWITSVMVFIMVVVTAIFFLIVDWGLGVAMQFLLKIAA